LKDRIDVIISTVNIKPIKNIKTIYVKPILTEKNIKELNFEFSQFKINRLEVDRILEIVSKYCTINDENGLAKDLENVFNRRLNFTEGVGEIMLQDLLGEMTIELNVEVKDWVEAVRFGGNLLYKNGCVTEEYVQAMIDNVREIGPYIVVTKGVAMPHAQPNKGALKVGVSLITLKNPVNFGNDENDPVYIVICFSATDSKTHLKALSQLAKLLDNEEALKKIFFSNSKVEALETIEEYS
jgi:mannitol/fructose-specific phosphotransferase system IIA component (Ntr-type)